MPDRVDELVGRGADPNRFAQRLSFFFYVHMDFFEEICKFRAARRLWARLLSERYGVTDEKALMFRFGVVCGGSSLTSAQPYNNIVRVGIENMAAVLGGCQSLHTNSMDETLGLPTEHAVTVALRTQQVLAFETGVTNTVDPLGGSYYVEWLTDRMEAEVVEVMAGIDAYGGTSLHEQSHGESFFALFKNSVRGTHHSISAKYLQRYLDEYTFRWNRRKCDWVIFGEILDRVEKAPLVAS